MRSPLLGPRWLGIHLLVVLLAAVCVAGTAWQFARAFEPDRTVITNPAEDLADAVPIGELLEPGQYMHPETHANTAVTATGHYDADSQLLVPASEEGVRGYHVILPLVTGDGAAVTVNRGWAEEGQEIPPVTDEEVTVSGWLQPPVADGGYTPVSPPEGQVERIATSLLVNKWDHPLYEGYVALPEQDPATDSLVPDEPPQPPTGITVNWRSLSYTLQWAMFGVSGVVFWIILMRRELADAREQEEGDPSEPEETPVPKGDQAAAADS